MSLVSLVEWNDSLGSADVNWGVVRAIRTAAKETRSDVHLTPSIYRLIYSLYMSLYFSQLVPVWVL